MNNNSNEPGLFFQVSDGNIVKAGPPAVLPSAPTSAPERGELWFDTLRGSLNIGTVEDAQKVWRSIAAPYLGGGGYVSFVAPEFEYSTDSIQNNGQALPYQTLSRAILEASKNLIQDILAGFPLQEGENRYTIYVGTSLVTPNCGLGTTIDGFTTNFSGDPYAIPTIAQLQQLNPTTGGIVVPKGISVLGMDAKKSVLSPAYVPSYRNPVFPVANAGLDQPLTSILKWSGNSYVGNFSAVDKIVSNVIDGVVPSKISSFATFHSKRPHGRQLGEIVQVSFASTVDQSTGTFVSGTYYAVPQTTFTFYLSTNDPTTQEATNYVLFASMPKLDQNGLPKFLIEGTPYSEHRLQVLGFASKQELANYYTKVQKAFPEFFGGKVTNGSQLVGEGETQIVGPTTSRYPNNTDSNTVKNSSAFVENLTVRSEYGLSGGDFDGALVTGFRSVDVSNCSVTSIQNDPTCYEIYSSFTNPSTGQPEQKWWQLTEATFLTIPLEDRPSSIIGVTREAQLQLLNETPLDQIRYYYRNLTSEDGSSFGIVDINNDFRHYGFRGRNGAVLTGDNVSIEGPAIEIWALNGGQSYITGSQSSLGSVALRAEGFLGINTLGGAFNNCRGFLFEGVQVPLALNRSQVEDTQNKQILSLGSRIVNVSLEEGNEGIQLLEMAADFSPCFILPYSLKPGSAIWVSSEYCTYRGFLATDGGPTVQTGQGSVTNAVLRVRASDSTIPNDPNLVSQLDIPYIRRFNDPRQSIDRSYSIVVSNTQPEYVAPPIGGVLRINQTGQTLGSSTVRPNVQLDPGSLGGWGRVFTVDNVATRLEGTSPNFNYVVGDAQDDPQYLIALTATDLGRPWFQTYNTSAGSYTTFDEYNYYAAENNIWSAVYYDVTLNEGTIGPERIAPVETCSPFVVTSVLDRQDAVATTYQGSYAPDPYLQVPTTPSYNSGTYYRGATIPYSQYDVQSYFDEDDSSESLGICLRDTVTSIEEILITAIDGASVVQAGQQPNVATNTRYRPEIVQFFVLSSNNILNPRQTVSILSLSHPSVQGLEYLRVVNLNGSLVEAIRLNRENSLYPDPPTPNQVWPVGTTAKICDTNVIPSPLAYDPDWANTKRALFRFFEVMGYSKDVTSGLFQPKYWGERLYPVTSIPFSPKNGYAITTAKWPLEFNQPSSVVASGHSWNYCGFLNYSRGLPQYQNVRIAKKLSFDYLCSTLWSGRLAVSGQKESGETILFGPQREALTAQFYEQLPSTISLSNQQVYENQPIVTFPEQIVVYSTDDISSQFDGTKVTFALTKSGFPVPASQLEVYSTFVQLGAVTQTPEVSYTINGTNIIFTVAPPSGATCDIRIVTSEDDQQTLVTVPFLLSSPFDGTTTNFVMEPVGGSDVSLLSINSENTFVFLGGVEQIPGQSYAIVIDDQGNILINFTEPPEVGATADVRTVTSGIFWSQQLIYPVSVYSLDDISPQFNNAKTSFTLRFNGVTINPSVVNTENLFVSVGGAMQLPTSAYSVNGSTITFTEPPDTGSTSNLRIVTNSEFLPCQQGGLESSVIRWGPGLILGRNNEITEIDSGLYPQQ